MASKETTAITTGQPAQYLALSLDPHDLQSNLAEVLGGESFTPNDFDRVTVPSGTSAAVWNIPNSEDAPKVLKGVIVHHTLARTMWLVPVDKSGGKSSPPDCVGKVSAEDGNMYGSKPQGWIYEAYEDSDYHQKVAPALAPSEYQMDKKQPCDTCPFSVFGTASSGKGQFCNLKRILYLLTPADPFPVVVVVPAKSLKNARSYLLSLGKKMLSPGAVETELTLVKDNSSNPPYYQIVFTQAGVLAPEDRAKAKAYQSALKPFIDATIQASPAIADLD